MFIRPLWFFFFDYYVGVRSKQKSTKMYDMAGEKKIRAAYMFCFTFWIGWVGEVMK
jgi:hypothetical protein